MPTTKPAALDLDSFAGFTPGPWHVGGHPGDNSGTEWREVLHDSPFGPAYLSQALAPNARVIAAAPALLAECKRLRAENERLRSGLTECVQFLEDRQDPDDTDEDHLISFARAALEPQS